MPPRRHARPVRRGPTVPATTCDGFVVTTDRDDPVVAIAAARAALRRVVGDDAGWRVRPLAVGSSDLDLTPPHGWQPRTPGGAFEMARTLDRQRFITAAEATFVGPGLVDPSHIAMARAGVRAARSGGGATAVNPDCEWSLKLTHVPEAWQLVPPAGGRTHGEGILVGHPDTGYTTHPEIWDADPALRRVRDDLGFDYVAGDPIPIDDLDDGFMEFPGHGTSTASVIMSGIGSAGDDRFVSGVAPKADLVPFRVSTSVVHLSLKTVARAIADATRQGCHVISMSLGGPFPSGALERAIGAARDAGIIVLAAAGNYWPWVVYPAAYDDVIAVAACDHLRGMWRWSATGDAVDVTAPGADVWVAGVETGNPPKYSVRPSSGTSHAVATTAGVAALWLAYHGRDALGTLYGASGIAPVFRSLLATAGVDTPILWDNDNCGAGVVDAARLLQAPLPAAAAVPRGRVRPARAGTAPWAHYFPNMDEDAVAAGLVAALGTTPARLRRALDRQGDEIVFLLATEPDLRAAVEGAAGPRPRRMRAPRRRQVAAGALRKASPTLRRQLQR